QWLGSRPWMYRAYFVPSLRPSRAAQTAPPADGAVLTVEASVGAQAVFRVFRSSERRRGVAPQVRRDSLSRDREECRWEQWHDTSGFAKRAAVISRPHILPC